MILYHYSDTRKGILVGIFVGLLASFCIEVQEKSIEPKSQKQNWPKNMSMCNALDILILSWDSAWNSYWFNALSVVLNIGDIWCILLVRGGKAEVIGNPCWLRINQISLESRCKDTWHLYMCHIELKICFVSTDNYRPLAAGGPWKLGTNASIWEGVVLT